jgi:DNA replication and repair protein RecF
LDPAEGSKRGTLHIRSLRANGWRNLAPLGLAPGPRTSVFFGENGQGKTNLLEAAYYLIEFRSFRSKTPAELVAWGAPVAELSAEVEAGGLVHRIEVEVGPGRKLVRLDGKAIRRDTPALARLGVVVFVPEDLLLPRASPAARRSFLDRAAFNVERLFYSEALAFQKVLKNRNAVLKRGLASPALLATYDEELARTGARIVMRRRSLTAALAPRVGDIFVAIHADLPARIRYRSDPTVEEATGEEDVRRALAQGLERTRALDGKRGFTGFGPHHDDLEILLAGRPVREHGSQGQVRSLVLALKLAELGHLRARLGEPPLLLLDDVASELDEIRRARLFSALGEVAGQTFVSVTDRQLVPANPERLDFVVSGGRVTAATSA